MELLTNNLGLYLLLAVISVLFSCNIWFARRLVLRIEAIDKTVSERFPVQANELKNMSEKIVSLEHGINQISKDFKDVALIRERIAVIEYALKGRLISKEEG
jgi:cell division protein FtsB